MNFQNILVSLSIACYICNQIKRVNLKFKFMRGTKKNKSEFSQNKISEGENRKLIIHSDSSHKKPKEGKMKAKRGKNLFVINQDMLLSPFVKEPEIIDLLLKFKQVLTMEIDIPKGSDIIVAVSGGVDSVVLLDLFVNISNEYNFTIKVVHYNHKLRKNSDRDEKFVIGLAKKYNIKCYNSSGDVLGYANANQMSLEQAGRILRYKYFENMAKNLGINYIATAHNLNDSVETFFLNLFRGSGLTGLAGIPISRQLDKNIQIVRPLISFKKDEIIRYAQERNLKWVEDETNEMFNYTRNRIRHDLIPKLQKDYNASILDIVIRTSKIIRGADDFIKMHINSILKSYIKKRNSNRFTLNISLIKSLDYFIQGELIQSALNSIFKIQNVSLQTIDRIIDLMDSPVGAKLDVTNRITAFKDREKLVFIRDFEIKKINMAISKIGSHDIDDYILRLEEVKKKDIVFSEDPTEEFFDYDLVPNLLHIRNWEPGDSFSPLGLNGTMKMSDFLINLKIPLFDKYKILVLSSGTEIIWVCGLRISDKFKITESTRRYLKAFLKKKNNTNK